ncbi:MAG: hypothetical protein V2B20_12825 [Pseudomonadota bacterium]
MKYAFIALIACYLLVYGCGPDNTKKTENKKEQAVHSTVEKPSQPTPPVQVAQPPETKTPPAAPVVDTPQPVQQIAPPPPVQEANKISPQPPQQMSEVGPQPPVVIEEQKSGEVAEEQKQQPCNIMRETPGAVELIQPDEQNIVILPCGRMFVKHPIPANAPCLNGQIPPCQVMDTEELDANEAFIMMPCGHVFVRQPMPEDEANLQQPQQMDTPCLADPQPQDVQEPEEDLSAAVQRMVEATNDMVLVTQQLVVATQEMLKATQGTVNAGTNIKENLQTENSVQAPGQTAEAPPQNQAEVEAQQSPNATGDATNAPPKTNESINQPGPKVL